MNKCNLAMLVLGAGVLASLAHGQTPASTEAPAPTAAPAIPTPSAEVTAPAAPATAADTASAPAPAPAIAKPDPVPGDSVNSVLTALGRPNGVITLADKSLMMFDRGNVMVSPGPNGVVTDVRLMSTSAYAAKLAATASDADQKQNGRARSGALLDILMNDPSYTSMSTRDRLLSLSRFDHDHPGSAAHQAYQDLLAVYSAELATQAKVTELQNEVVQARADATAAQQQTASVQKELDIAQQQLALAQQQAINAQRQAAVVEQNTVVNNNQAGGPVRAGGGGIAITAGKGAPPPRPATPTNSSGSILVVMPDGSVKLITPQNPQGTVVTKGT